MNRVKIFEDTSSGIEKKIEKWQHETGANIRKLKITQVKGWSMVTGQGTAEEKQSPLFIATILYTAGILQ